MVFSLKKENRNKSQPSHVVEINRIAWVKYRNLYTKIIFDAKKVKDVDDFKKEVKKQLQLDVIAALISFQNSKGSPIRMEIDQPLPMSFENKKDALHIDIATLTDSQSSSRDELYFQPRQTPGDKDVPSLEELIDAAERKPCNTKAKYAVGSWVEYLTLCMQWKIGFVKDVTRKSPQCWDWTSKQSEEPMWDYYYNVSDVIMLPEWKLRTTKKGLNAIFGSRPWLWQQYAILKLENILQFDEHHPLDFEKLECHMIGYEWFHDWLNAPENHVFQKFYEEQTIYAQDALKTHLLKPFIRIDYINNASDGDDWTLDSEVSLYTYISVMGSGWISSFAAIFVQMVAPVILMHSCVTTTPRLAVKGGGWDISMDTICSKTGSFEGKVLTIAVFVVYLLKIVPYTMASLRNLLGNADNVSSRISSLRTRIWFLGRDTFSQQIGYKVEIYMNTGYTALLYLINLAILYLSDSVSDILYNALAIEFIARLDEEACGIWWDNDGRWMHAGVIELIIRSSLQLDWLNNPKKISSKFEINEENTSIESLENAECASRDSQNQTYNMLPERLSEKMNEKLTRWKENPKIVHFGFLEKILYQIGIIKTGMFHRHNDFYTWSIWEKLLYAPKVPTSGRLDTSPATRSRRISERNTFIEKIEFHELTSVQMAQFKKDSSLILHILNVLFLGDMFRSLRCACQSKSLLQVIMSLFDSMIKWILYFILALFPLLVFSGSFFVGLCY